MVCGIGDIASYGVKSFLGSRSGDKVLTGTPRRISIRGIKTK